MNKKYKPAGKYAIKTFNKKYKDHDREIRQSTITGSSTSCRRTSLFLMFQNLSPGLVRHSAWEQGDFT